MSAKVYLFLDLVSEDSEQVAQTLRSKPGVATVDVLEGPPDLLTVIEAPQRQKAAEYLLGLLDSVDGMIANLRVMPVQEPTGKSTEDCLIRRCSDAKRR